MCFLNMNLIVFPCTIWMHLKQVFLFIYHNLLIKLLFVLAGRKNSFTEKQNLPIKRTVYQYFFCIRYILKVFSIIAHSNTSCFEWSKCIALKVNEIKGWCSFSLGIWHFALCRYFLSWENLSSPLLLIAYICEENTYGWEGKYRARIEQESENRSLDAQLQTVIVNTDLKCKNQNMIPSKLTCEIKLNLRNKI